MLCVGVVEYTLICTLKAMHIKLAVSYIHYFQLFNVWIMSYKQNHSLIATHPHKSFFFGKCVYMRFPREKASCLKQKYCHRA
jgi:hypothetical protein